MARSVRKVSRQSTKNQKKEINKKWVIAIISFVVLVIAGLGLGLGLYFGLKDSDEAYVSDKIYFVDPILNSQNEEVSGFNKENYQALNRYTSDEYGDIIEHRFIFVYDGSAFYADEKDEEHYDEKSDYVKLLKQIADLQTAVNKAKAAGVEVELYIVDTHVDSGTNKEILSDQAYGALGNDTNYPAFIYMHNNEFQEKFEENKKNTISVGGNNWHDISASSIPYTLEFLGNLTNQQ